MPAIALRLMLSGLLLSAVAAQARDENFHIYLCFGQSNMEGFPGIPEEDKTPVDPRFQVLAAVDFPEMGRTAGNWYPAVPPLCRPGTGLCPSDYFGRTLVAKLPDDVRVGVVNVSVAGGRIEVFEDDRLEAYAATAPDWMQGIIANYGGSPYRRLVELGRRAQEDGVIKGILLHQGESNTNETAWLVSVKSIYERLLSDLDLDAADVPLLAGELVGSDQGGCCSSMNAIIGTLPELVPTAHVISSAGCPCHEDKAHFTPEGYRMLGTRYAEAMLPLLEPSREP